MADPIGLDRNDFTWTEEPVIGTALIIKGASIDSFGNKIRPETYYEVGKRKSDGMVTLLPVAKKKTEGKIILN